MPPYLKKSIIHAYLEMVHTMALVLEIGLNGPEADEPLVNTQMTVIKHQSGTQDTKTLAETTKRENLEHSP